MSGERTNRVLETDDSVERAGGQRRAGAAEIERVEIKLDGESLTNVVGAIETFLNGYQKSFWYSATAEITRAIRRELLKSRNPIDVKLVTEVFEHLSKNSGMEKEKKKKKKVETGIYVVGLLWLM